MSLASSLVFNPLATARPVKARRAVSCRKPTVVKASLNEDDDQRRASPAVAALLASALIASAPVIAPDEAFAAQSSGRVGGSSFRSSRAAPAQTQSRTVVNNTTIVTPGYAPPVFGGFYSPFGFSFMPTFFFPIGFGAFGFIFQLFLVLTLVSFVVSVVSNMQAQNKKDDDIY